MSLHLTIKSYTLIIEKLQQDHHPSLEDLLLFLENERVPTTTRSLNRYIQQLRTDFGIEIKYDRGVNGYYIDEEHSDNFDTFLSFLELATTSELLVSTLQDSKKALNYISFESEGILKGVENLRLVLKGLRQNRMLQFRHFNYLTDKIFTFEIEPYLLKQYQNRWYVLGRVPSRNHFRTFGVDRIHELKVLNRKFKRDSKARELEKFKKIVGLSNASGKAERVVLTFTYPQAHYAKSLKLHETQVEIEDDHKSKYTVSLSVIPNHELKQKIMMQGENVIVESPPSLRNEIREMHRKAYKRY